MVIAADYPFLDIFWSMLIFFVWVLWIWTVIMMLTDVFRRDDIGGWAKAGWVAFMVVLPFLGVFVYLITQHKHMAERNAAQFEAAQAQQETYIKSVAGRGGATEEIARGKELLDSGAITQSEFDTLKVRALAA
jgi:hypothetical protein